MDAYREQLTEDGTCVECGYEPARCNCTYRNSPTHDDHNPRYVTDYDDEGFHYEAQLTSEGVIIDLFDDEGDLVDTFGQLYEEILPRV